MNAQLGIRNDAVNPSRIKTLADKQKEKLALELDNLISATVTAKENGKTVLTTSDNNVFEADSHMVNGEIGDELYFKVVSSNGRPVLKQVQIAVADAGQSFMKLKSAAELKDMLKQNGFAPGEHVSKNKSEADEEQKAALALSRIRRQLKTAGGADVNAVRELVAGGVSLGKISLPLLNSALKEINAKPGLKDASEHSDNPSAPSADTLRRLGAIKDLGDDEIAAILKSGKKLTLDNIYMLKHGAGACQPDTEIVKNLSNEILRVLDENGLPKNEDNIQASERLVSYGIDLTKENIQKYIFLKNIGEGDNLSLISLDSKDAAHTDLFEYYEIRSKNALYENYSDIINNFPRMANVDFDMLIKRQIPLTLRNIRTADIRNDNNPAPESKKAADAKQTLIEIRLKLTHEAAFRLASMNISIDLSPLTEALEVLKAQQQDEYASNLRMMGGSVTAESTGVMQDLFEKLRVFGHITHSALGNVVRNMLSGTDNSLREQPAWGRNAAFNVNNTYNAITAVSALYESNSTYVRVHSDFKDLDAQLTSFIEKIGATGGIETKASEANLSAARILFENNLDITADSIAQVRLIAAKIDRLYNTLHPNIAASMIRDGVNPLTEHIDNMLDYIEGFNNAYGESLGDKIASFIYDSDMNQSYTAEERQGIIAIYRMLNTMLKNGGAGIGQIVKNNTPLTLGRMMDSAKLAQKVRKRDYKIDESFGERSDLSDSGINDGVRASIKDALDSSANLEARADIVSELAELNLKNIAEHAHPEHLRGLLNSNPDAESMTIDEIIEYLADYERDNPEVMAKYMDERIMEHTSLLRGLADTDPRMIKWMTDNNVNCNINSILTMQQAVKDPFLLRKRLESASESLEDAEDYDIAASAYDIDLDGLGSTEDISAALKSIDRGLERAADDIRFKPDKIRSGIKAINEARELIRRTDEISERGSKGFKIPVRLKDKVSSLNMYYLNDNRDDNSVLLALETDTLGMVRVYARTEDGKLRLNITAEHSDDVLRLEKNSEMLVEFIRKSGFLNGDGVEIEMEFAAVKSSDGVLEPDTASGLDTRVGRDYSYDINI